MSKKTKQKKCASCGDDFIPNHGREKCCSEECRKKRHTENTNRLRFFKICRTCGKEFMSNKKRTKFCSYVCSGNSRKISKDDMGKIEKRCLLLEKRSSESLTDALDRVCRDKITDKMRWPWENTYNASAAQMNPLG